MPIGSDNQDDLLSGLNADAAWLSCDEIQSTLNVSCSECVASVVLLYANKSGSMNVALHSGGNRRAVSGMHSPVATQASASQYGWRA